MNNPAEKTNGRSARKAAAKVLAEVLAGRSLAAVLPAYLERMDKQDRPLCQELVYSTLREYPRLVALSDQLLKKPMKQKDQDIYALILLGLQQLSGSRVADHAAVSETVEVTKALKKQWATGFVNGVLRSYQRDAEKLEAALDAAATLALPTWLHQFLACDYPAVLPQIAAAYRNKPPLTLRVNVNKTSPQDYLESLASEGIEATQDDGVPTAITLERARDVFQLPNFEAGFCSVQDASAQLAAMLLEPRAGESVLDACAAPGGKTCHIAEMAPDLAKLDAWDISEDRLERVIENQERLGLTFDVTVMDASQPEMTEPAYDAILVDAPCSATGVIRRNPDVKVTRTASDVLKFAKQQRAILSGLWPLLKPGGRLLYATCSIMPAENDEVVDWALQTLPNAELAAISAPGAQTTRNGVQRIPDAMGGDGLYYSLLRKL